MMPIAIIGMAGIFPGAPDLARYWSNIVQGVDAITKVPSHRWSEVFYDPQSAAVNRLYCRRGGFIDDFVEFDPLQHGVVPQVAKVADPEQMLTLQIGVEAMRDAGYSSREFAAERTGVIIGRGNYLTAGTLRLDQQVRVAEQAVQLLADLMPGLDTDTRAELQRQLQARLDSTGPDVAAGVIPNLVASRLAHRLNLRGPAYTVDAACASSLLAVEQACQLLASGACELMLAGGVHLTHDLTLWATLCQLGAMSRRETSQPFGRGADGLLPAEGVGIVVLKRADWARRDGDRIYAVIEGVGSASDGRSTGLLAPSVTGQVLALERAWRTAGVTPNQIGLLEAHGTATPAGDAAELQTVREFFGPRLGTRAHPPVIGSVKSMIGHAMPAAGMAGLIKAALAVYHGVLPPTLHCEDPHPLLLETPFRALTAAQPWHERQRVAAVNAFGFGGVNAHVILSSQDAPAVRANHAGTPLPTIALLAATSRTELLDKLQRRDWDREPGAGQWRLAIIAPTEQRIELALQIVTSGARSHGRHQIYFSGEALLREGQVAFVFPGVDSEFAPRAQDIAEYFRLPLPAHCERTDVCTSLPSVVTGTTQFNLFLHGVARRLGIPAHALVGHSIGEWSAFTAAGILGEARAQAVLENLDGQALDFPDVVFLAAACDRATLEALLGTTDDLAVSHDNCPHQVIVCGAADSVTRLQASLRAQHILTQILPFASGFHSPFFVPHLAPYQQFFRNEPFAEPQIPVWSCTTALPLQNTAEAQRLAIEHLVKPVEFRRTIENLYAAGFRAFIQMGTGSLTGFVQDTLRGKPHLAIAANVAKATGMEQLCSLTAALWTEGLAFDPHLLRRAPSASSKAGASTLKLELGVPLVRFEPLPTLPRRAPASLLGAAEGDPLHPHFAAVLADIEQVNADIVALWQRRRTQAAPAPQSLMTGTLTLRKHLDIRSNIACVRDHAFHRQRADWPNLADWRPIVPLTMELELLREVIEQAYPGFVVTRFEDVAAHHWLAVAEPLDIDMVIVATHFPRLEVSIEGYLTARAVLASDYPTPPTARTDALVRPRAAAIDALALYRDNWMFHGPAYQGVQGLGPIGDNGIHGRLRVTAGQGALLDSMGQLAGYWVMEQENSSLAMPVRVEAVDFYARAPAVGSDFDCRISVRSASAEYCITDQQLLDGAGHVAVAITGWTALRYGMSRDFYRRSKQLEKYVVSEHLGERLMVFEDRYPTAVLRDYLARRYLSERELASYEAQPPRRKRAWLNGRIAAKDAVRAYLWAKHGEFELFPKEIAITNDAAGVPRVATHVTQAFTETLHVSIAHQDRVSIASVSEAPVGVAVEAIVAHDVGGIDGAFSADELERLPRVDRDHWIARCWAAKKATAKRSSRIDPERLMVHDIAGQSIAITPAVLDAAASTLPKLSWVQTHCRDGYAMGWTQ